MSTGEHPVEIKFQYIIVLDPLRLLGVKADGRVFVGRVQHGLRVIRWLEYEHHGEHNGV